MSSSNFCFLTCIQIYQEAGQVVWFLSLSEFSTVYCDPHKGFGIVNKAKIDVFSGTLLLFPWSSRCWQFDLWFLCVFESQLEHLEVHGSCIVEAWLGEFWALLYWRVRWVQLCGNFSILWHCLSLWLGGKLTSSSPMATAKFSKFAGILSAALSQHHLSGFEIAQLEFHHLH